MFCEKIDLFGDKSVMLYSYIQRTPASCDVKRKTVIVLPGGGYFVHGFSEGEPVAAAFAGKGYNAFLLRYSIEPNAVFPRSAADACAAVKYVRENANRYNADPDGIIFCGFSAGGHVAACAATMWNEELIKNASGCTGKEGRPDAVILGYPVIFTDFERHEESFMRLLGDRSRDELIKLASANLHVDSETPPVFIWNIAEDKVVSPIHSVRFQEALINKGIPYEMHTYVHGVHASSLNTPAVSLGDKTRENKHTANWFEEAVEWIEEVL